MQPQVKGAIYAITSGFLYGFIGYFGINILDLNFSIGCMTFWRFFVSACAIFCIMLIQRKSYTYTTLDAIKSIINGALCYAPSTLIYFKSSSYIGSGLAMVIFFTYPAIVMLINRFVFKQPLNTKTYLSMFVILIGLILLVDWETLNADITGILLQILSAGFYAAYMLAAKRVSMPTIPSALWVSVGCALMGLIFALFTHSFNYPHSPVSIIYVLGIGIISTATPIILLLNSMRYLSAEKASILSVTEPVFVVIVGVLLLGELLNIKEVFGIIVILAGALLVI